MFRLNGALTTVCIALLLCNVGLAGPNDPVITPVGVTGSADTVSSFTDPFGSLINLINGDTDPNGTNNGLVEDGTANPEVPVALATEQDALDSDHRNIFTGEDPGLAGWHWVTAGRNGDDFSDFFDSSGDPGTTDAPITIDFDLGGTFDVGGMFVWRYNGGFGSLEQNNPKDWTIEFSTDGGSNYGNMETIPTLTNSGLGGNAVGSELLSFTSHQADSVRITITDNFKGEPGLAFGGDRVGLAEVRFQGLEVASDDADFDMDTDVDGADFLIWQRGFGAMGSGTLATGDANGDTNIDAADLAIWETQYGSGALVASITSVPEPSTTLLFCVGLSLIGSRRNRCGVNSPTKQR